MRDEIFHEQIEKTQPGAAKGHASLMGPVKPAPGVSFVGFAATQLPKRLQLRCAAELTRWRHGDLRFQFMFVAVASATRSTPLHGPPVALPSQYFSDQLMRQRFAATAWNFPAEASKFTEARRARSAVLALL
jgi:hypothetical protein